MLRFIKYLAFLVAAFCAINCFWILAMGSLVLGVVLQINQMGREIRLSDHLFLIGGYDRMGTQFVNRMVASSKKEDITENEQDEIYYFGLSEIEIKDAIEKGNDSLPFIITSYTKVY